MTVEQKPHEEISLPRSGAEIRSAFLNFYRERGHKVFPSASLVPEDPTVLLTIAGMLPFKRIFLGQKKRPAARVTSTQKCIRTNDIENVGRTARHQTFFEMLGNFSFGDYFKKDAIQWAWELSTNVLGLRPENLVISVFREDEEAECIWREVVGVNPKRIISMDEADNFWSSGPTGPCGPCSEIYYDFTPELGDENIDLEDDTRFIEFYNLVFMQYNRDASGELTTLANKSIDTGMGLERIAQILQKVPNNYETDLIFPIILNAASLAGVDYQKIDEIKKTSLKIIGDHSRAVTFLISDGVTASNLGRGYILRRLIRRVIRHGKLLGIKKPFLMTLGETVIETMKSSYPLLDERRKIISSELQREESKFLETLERGEKLLSEILKNNPQRVSGEKAFELYDTYGFPLELTQEIAEENGISVDLEGFKKEMEKQRQRAKNAAINIDLTLQDAIDELARRHKQTLFNGYNNLEQSSQVQGLVVNGRSTNRGSSGDQVQIILDNTTFYGESGGQVGDSGVITHINQQNTSLLVEIDSVTRSQNIFIHHGYIKNGDLKVGDTVQIIVNNGRRQRAQVHHTATHLLQAALKKIIDPDINQAGSLVDFNRLRFDFNCSHVISSKELKSIEDLINNWITESHPLETQNMTLEKAKSIGAIAMFGEKYSDTVRVVDVPGVSMELCGGTHVKNTSEIGVFKIISESGISAGIRRIEAVAGPAILEFLNERDDVVKSLSARFKAQPNEICERVEVLQTELKNLSKTLEATQEELALTKVIGIANEATIFTNGTLLTKRIDGIDGSALQKAAEKVRQKLGDKSAVILGGLPKPNDQTKVILVAAFGKDLITTGLQAGKFIGDIAKLCDGGGGGRPNLAQAGGRNGKALDQALDIATQKLQTELK